MFEIFFEKAQNIEKKVDNGLFPIKKVDKGDIVPINVIIPRLPMLED